MRQYRYSRSSSCKRCKDGLLPLAGLKAFPTIQDLCPCIRDQLRNESKCELSLANGEVHVTEWVE
jgi:hypothetical protein